MANVYVRSAAAGAGTGADWDNAYTTLAAALAAKAAGDDFWVAEDHNETTAGAIAATSPGTAASPCRIICVNHSGSVPPVAADMATTGLIATSGANSITFSGYAYCYGLSFTAGTTTNNASLIMSSSAAERWVFDSCKLIIGNTNTGASIQIGNTGAVSMVTEWNNTTVKFGSTSQSIQPNGGDLFWRNTSSAIDTGGSVPTNLFSTATCRSCRVFVEGVDLSAAGSGKTIVNATTGSLQANFKDCKLGASVTLSATPSSPGQRTFFTRCSDTAGNHIEVMYAYEGTQTDETTIVRTGGSSDGTTSKSRKIVTTANARFAHPFVTIPLAIWNDTSGSSLTATVYGIWGGASVPNNDDVWIDVEYLGSSTTPLGSFATNGKASVLATNAAQSSDSSTWGGSTTAFKMTRTFTPQQKGWVYIYVKAGAASSTIYIDPLPVVA